MPTEPCPYCGRRIPATTTPIKKCGYCGGEWIEKKSANTKKR
jgi:rRNA maturation endonuclease Nob1